ncbi:DinB family protein [Phytohalomonas tamaricis]|uniref:DinB family protein n=1 Tax=Phytohalomonas tamaricis TaxID=2081032 RepID=UPI000D0BE237|nr:DinB family protein [Phytohalomonas tamaricis]
MLADHLRTLIDYHGWATERMLEACSVITEGDYRRDLGLFFHGIHGTLNHLLTAERLWHARLKGTQPPTNTLETKIEADRDVLARALREQCRYWKAATVSLNDADTQRTIAFTNDCGQLLQLSVAELIFHVVNHGTHHRGQLSAALNGLGEPMPELDFYYYRLAP